MEKDKKIEERAKALIKSEVWSSYLLPLLMKTHSNHVVSCVAFARQVGESADKTTVIESARADEVESLVNRIFADAGCTFRMKSGGAVIDINKKEESRERPQ